VGSCTHILYFVPRNDPVLTRGDAHCCSVNTYKTGWPGFPYYSPVKFSGAVPQVSGIQLSFLNRSATQIPTPSSPFSGIADAKQDVCCHGLPVIHFFYFRDFGIYMNN